MTLEQYKQQVSEIHEAGKNFNGTPEEAVKFFEDLAKKYPEACEFNAKAMETKDLTEFKSLADSFGMKFSSDESAEKLFTMLHEGKKQFEAARMRYEDGMELSDEDLDSVTAGFLDRLKTLFGTLMAPVVAGALYVTEGEDAAEEVFTETVPYMWVYADTVWSDAEKRLRRFL